KQVAALGLILHQMETGVWRGPQQLTSISYFSIKVHHHHLSLAVDRYQLGIFRPAVFYYRIVGSHPFSKLHRLARPQLSLAIAQVKVSGSIQGYHKVSHLSDTVMCRRRSQRTRGIFWCPSLQRLPGFIKQE